jgi:hypothetical protein
MSGRTEPDWNRWEASLGRVQAVREWRSFPCKAALQTSDLNCRGDDGDAGNDVSPSRGDWI